MWSLDIKGNSKWMGRRGRTYLIQNYFSLALLFWRIEWIIIFILKGVIFLIHTLPNWTKKLYLKNQEYINTQYSYKKWKINVNIQFVYHAYNRINHFYQQVLIRNCHWKVLHGYCSLYIQKWIIVIRTVCILQKRWIRNRCKINT